MDAFLVKIYSVDSLKWDPHSFLFRSFKSHQIESPLFLCDYLKGCNLTVISLLVSELKDDYASSCLGKHCHNLHYMDSTGIWKSVSVMMGEGITQLSCLKILNLPFTRFTSRCERSETPKGNFPSLSGGHVTFVVWNSNESWCVSDIRFVLFQQFPPASLQPFNG